MRKVLILFLFVAPSLLGATYNIGPGKTYTNIGDAPWSSMVAGDVVDIYPKTDITAVTASSSTGTTMTLTTSSGSIPYGSSVWFSGLSSAQCEIVNGFWKTSGGSPNCTLLDKVTCGVKGSGLYGTATGGTACTGDTVTLAWALSVGSGVTVYFQPPYFEKIIVTVAATSGSPFVVQGIPDATTGAYPILDADYATTGPNMAHTGSTTYHDSYGFVMFMEPVSGAGLTGATYATLEGLRIQNTVGGVTAYDGSNTPYTYASGEGIRLEYAINVKILNNEILSNDLGIFGADNIGVSPPDVLTNVDINGNHLLYNGRLAGEHQSYIESLGAIYENNWYDTTGGTDNSQIKDRSTGRVVRYNRIVATQGFGIDMVDAQNSFYDLVHMDALAVPTGGFAQNATTLTPVTWTVTASTTLGSPTVGVSSTANLATGMAIVGTGIPANATIGAVLGGGVWLADRQVATATGAGITATVNTVQSINAGDRVCYINATVGWGYPGSGQPVCPTVVTVNTGTNTLTLNAPGIPAALAAGQVIQVISRQPYPYLQSFTYGNVFDYSQAFAAAQLPSPIHCCWDTAGGIDSVSDPGSTNYVYYNSFVVQLDQSKSYGIGGFRLESDADTFQVDDNFWYITNYTPLATPTYLILLTNGGYTLTNLVSTTFAGGSNQVGSSTGVGSTTSCSVTWVGVEACNYPLDPGATATLTNFTPEAPSSLFPSGLGGFPYVLSSGSSAIGVASSLPAAIASNTLGSDFTPTLNYGGTTRTSLNDLGATQSGVGSGLSLSLLPGTALTPGTEIR